MEKYFNFNNEADLTSFDLREDGTVYFELGDQNETFNSVEEFAEFYAVARNVKPENLKNWVLVEDDDTYAYVLRAGTAGLELNELVESLSNAGMTPEEIGQAIRAYQDENESEDEELVDPTDSDTLREAVEGYNGYEREILETKVDFENPEQYTEYHVDAEDEDYSYTEYGREAVDLWLHDIITKVKSELKDEYPDIPVEIAWDLSTSNVRETHDEAYFASGDKALEEYFKASLASQIAHRQVPITIIDIDGSIESRNWGDDVEYDDETAVVYAVRHKFFIVPKIEDVDAVVQAPLD